MSSDKWTNLGHFLYDPMVKKTFIPVIPFFNHFLTLKEYYGNKYIGDF